MSMRTVLAALFSLLPMLALASQDEIRELLFEDAMAARGAADAVAAKTYSPRSYERGAETLADAERDFRINRPLERIRQGAAEAAVHFRSAAETARAAQESLSGLIKLREAALSVDGGLADEDSWLAGERRFREAIIEFERGDKKLAARRAGEAEAPYRQAELAGIKARYLNEARRVLAQAEEARAERYAPTTYARAKQLLAVASKELTEDRYDIDRPRDLARQAEVEARHALYLADYVRRARKEKIDAEALILAGEVPLRQIAGAADLSVNFHQGYELATVAIMDYIEALQDDLRNTRQDLYERNAQVDALETQLDSLESRLGGISEERKALEAELARQEREREQFARIETMFTDDQADVLRDGGEVIIRLVGTSFPSGQAAIEPTAYELLGTLIRAVDIFPNSQVRIEGHTDAYGSDSFNMELSQKRADAVLNYVLENSDIEAFRLSATGYGETRPIANNETEEGRARNRRTDVVIRPRATR